MNEHLISGMYAILIPNDIVCSWAVDALGELKKYPSLYRQQVKQHVKAMEKERVRYERMVNGLLRHNSEFFGNAVQKVSDQVMPHIMRLYFSIANVLKRHKVEDADVIARFETLRTLAEISCKLYGMNAQFVFKHSGQKLHGEFRLTRMFALLDRIQSCICKGPGFIDLNTDENCTLGIDPIVNILSNHKIILEAVYKSDEELVLEDLAIEEEIA